jgi:hypothetical protein
MSMSYMPLAAQRAVSQKERDARAAQGDFFRT